MFTFLLLLVGIAVSSASPVLSEGSAISSRIVNGRDGDIAEVPWLASMEVDGRRNCGGSIISEYWIVSAAHCFHRDVSRYTARVGSSYPSSGGSVHTIELYINHPLYDTVVPTSHDINLVKVVEPIVYSALVQPISLPAQSVKVASDALSTVAGWGFMTSFPAIMPTILQITHIPVISRQECLGYYSTARLSEDMLCAGFTGEHITPCTGDSGGPLSTDKVLVGVVSWGSGCFSPGLPSVYADVAYFRDWITENSGV